jgi:hypothetical protein
MGRHAGASNLAIATVINGIPIAIPTSTVV